MEGEEDEDEAWGLVGSFPFTRGDVMGQIAKVSRQARLQQILHGLGVRFPNVSTLMLGGVDYTMDELKRLVQGDLDAMEATAQAVAAFRTLVQRERNTHAKVNPILRLLKAYVIASYGDTQDASGALADFGYAPRKSSKKTLATKVEAVDKAKATREARHTVGPKQKAKIKGTVPAPPAPAPGA